MVHCSGDNLVALEQLGSRSGDHLTDAARIAPSFIPGSPDRVTLLLVPTSPGVGTEPYLCPERNAHDCPERKAHDNENGDRPLTQIGQTTARSEEGIHEHSELRQGAIKERKRETGLGSQH